MQKFGENKGLKKSKTESKQPQRLKFVCKVSHQCRIFGSVKAGETVSVSPVDKERLALQYWVKG